jgi:hypothetical protein
MPPARISSSCVPDCAMLPSDMTRISSALRMVVQPVSDDQQRFAAAQLADGLLDVAFVVRVHAGGGLVENDDGRVLENAAAMEMRCFSPPERVSPPSPITVSRPSGSAVMKS